MVGNCFFITYLSVANEAKWHFFAYVWLTNHTIKVSVLFFIYFLCIFDGIKIGMYDQLASQHR